MKKMTFAEIVYHVELIFEYTTYATIKFCLLAYPLAAAWNLSNGITESKIIQTICFLFFSIPEIIQTARGKKTRKDELHLRSVESIKSHIDREKNRRLAHERYVKCMELAKQEEEINQKEQAKTIINNANGDFRHDLYIFDDNIEEKPIESDEKKLIL